MCILWIHHIGEVPIAKVVKVLCHEFVGCEIELQSRYYVHFRSNSFGTLFSIKSAIMTNYFVSPQSET